MLSSVDQDETDGGPRMLTAARAPDARLCLATRQVTPLSDMLRYVVGPDGAIVPDLSRKLPGRGAWVTATRAALDQAIKRKAFGRAFKGKGQSAPDLPDLVETLLVADTRAALSLANKAGRVVTGTTKVQSALSDGNISLLLHASDARPDGIRKLNGFARQLEAAGMHPVAIVDCLSGVELDLALGRSNVVHAALLSHPTTAGFLARCRRLERWRMGTTASVPEGHCPPPDRMQGTDTE
ncbi:DNA-binding protein [Azorhizobium oxalatiphilum]|uniref:DNA-binding protein n=2 Tax=Azorhizobium oxalatiphilum TaxID=980631 RepID=A0A917CC69_9HYPH|nr:DNA-binding protein [Azorhizobium oxalatiphilum]